MGQRKVKRLKVWGINKVKITSQEQAESLIKNGVLTCTDDLLEITCDISIDANINAGNINAGNINAGNIDAWHITAKDINAGNICAWHVNAGNIVAKDIIAKDIDAWNINARDILYYGVCFAYKDINCTSIRGRRENARHFCLDGEITIKDKKHTITIDGKEIELSEESFNNLREQLK